MSKRFKSWRCTEHHGRRGRGYIYSDVAIETALVVKGVFNLSLRALEGFTNSIFQLMDVPLSSPSYSCISKRAKTVEIKYRAKSHGPVSHVVIDSTGLWRKLHLAVDSNTHEIVSAEVTLVNVADNEVLPTLLNPLRRRIAQVSADGAYDTKACHKLLKRKGCKPTIPPRSNGGYREEGHPRNEAVKALKANQLSE